MNVLFIMLPIALLLSGFFVMVFIWAASSGQFDDSVTPAHRILNDNDDVKERKIDEISI